MSIKRIIAVGAIFVLACAGWCILGSAMAVRTTGLSNLLGPKVENLWGAPLAQKAPSLAVQIPGTDDVRWLIPSKNNIKVSLDTDYRRKGLIWYPTYNCSFDGNYTIENSEDVGQKIRMHFDFPAPGETYDNFAFTIDEKPLTGTVDTHEGISKIIELAPGESREVRITYKTRGIKDWRYQMDPNIGRVKNLNLVLKTNFEDIDYTDGSLSPMSVDPLEEGMMVTWEATDLITQDDIGVIIPEKLNPGPVTTRITFFAPVCLIFFFILIATINILYKVNIHPMHYLFVAAGFFAFHLLLAYMVDIINIHVSFIISAIISVVLVTGYLYAALKGKFPWKIAVAGQMFFLVLFSYSFFLKGITGLTVAIGSVVTLGILMKLTANTDWNEVFKKKTKVYRSSPPSPPKPATFTPGEEY